MDQADQTTGIGFVWGISHGDQWWIQSPGAPSARNGRRLVPRRSQSPSGGPWRKSLKETGIDEQRFITDESCPILRVSFGVPAEIKAAEHLDQFCPVRNRSTLTSQQFEAGIPVVVPEPLGFESVDIRRLWAPAAVVTNGLLKSPSIAAGHITDDTVDVEEDKRAAQRNAYEQLVG